jgi:hypothetical protein
VHGPVGRQARRRTRRSVTMLSKKTSKARVIPSRLTASTPASRRSAISRVNAPSAASARRSASPTWSSWSYSMRSVNIPSPPNVSHVDHDEALPSRCCAASRWSRARVPAACASRASWSSASNRARRSAISVSSRMSSGSCAAAHCSLAASAEAYAASTSPSASSRTCNASTSRHAASSRACASASAYRARSRSACSRSRSVACAPLSDDRIRDQDTEPSRSTSRSSADNRSRASWTRIVVPSA